VPILLKYGSLNLLESSVPFRPVIVLLYLYLYLYINAKVFYERRLSFTINPIKYIN
jgi:hypothetical protein